MHSAKGAEAGLEPGSPAPRALLCSESSVPQGNAWSGGFFFFFFKGPVQSLSGLFLRESPWSAEGSCSLSPAPRHPGRPRVLPYSHGAPHGARGAWQRQRADRSQQRSVRCGTAGLWPSGSWWPRMFTRSLGKPRCTACGHAWGGEDTGPVRHLCRISMRTKNYKLKKIFFLRYLQNMVYFYVEKKSYEGSCYFERKFIKSP